MQPIQFTQLGSREYGSELGGGGRARRDGQLCHPSSESHQFKEAILLSGERRRDTSLLLGEGSRDCSLLEETQMRMTELAISPGPPPPPQLTTIFSGSQLGKLNGLHTTLDGASSGVSYSCDSQAVVLWCRLF